uniref:Uncharacterized protein n=1 Tax=Mastacembelus armatus TaxID=205130 RepID=A0A3Q3MYY3_9TELE
MELKFAELQPTLDKLSSHVEDNTKRITEIESRVSDAEDRTCSLENKVAELERRVKTVKERAEDSENRTELQPPIQHQTMQLLHQKKGILIVAREKGELNYKGSKIHIQQDLSAQVRDARRWFNGVCEQVICNGMRFQMHYPANLSFTYNEKYYSFRSAEEAGSFLNLVKEL